MDDMIQLSPRQRDDLRRMVQQAGVDARDVPYRTTKRGWIQLYCPVCLKDDRWRSTRACETRAEALGLLREHLREHGRRLIIVSEPALDAVTM